jgi:isoleucyl-tRNA synthetase
MIWNMYDFFTMYAEVDGWEFDGALVDPLTGNAVAEVSSGEDSAFPAERGKTNDQLAPSASETDETEAAVPVVTNPLDIWIVSRLHQMVAEVEEHMDEYDIPSALEPILPFLDDASNWYVRRSRRRFWKSEDDSDKNDAYRTLHYVLVRLAYVLAPFTPFLAEELHHNLTGDEESIHLKDWLPAGNVNELELERMRVVRELINEGLSQRAVAGIKVRQPLGGLKVGLPSMFDYPENMSDDPDYDNIVSYKLTLLDELNVKGAIENVLVEDGKHFIELDLTITPELKREGLMREVVRHVQAARKKAGLNVDDRIRLGLTTKDEELRTAITEHADTIASETLAHTPLQDGDKLAYEETIKVEGSELIVSLVKD